jgi:hypothetical protein
MAVVDKHAGEKLELDNYLVSNATCRNLKLELDSRILQWKRNGYGNGPIRRKFFVPLTINHYKIKNGV